MILQNNLYKILLGILILSLFWTFTQSEAAQVLTIKEVKICGRNVNSQDKVLLRYKDLDEGKIKITAEVLDIQDVASIEVSIDAGNNWIGLEKNSPWEYEFIPKTGRGYTFLAHTVDKNGQRSRNFIAIIQPDTQELVSIFDEIFRQMRNFYIDERLREFLDFFDAAIYLNFIAFTENMENTFEQSSNFNLKIIIRNVGIDKEDTALVRVDWIKTYEDTSRDSAYNNIIRFHKVNGEWKIFDIEDEKIFIVGTGTFKGNITDR